MGRPNKFSDEKRAEILARKDAGESVRKLAKIYKIAPSTIISFSKHSEQVKLVANQIVATTEAIEALTVSEQIHAQSYARKLLAISSNLTDVGIAGTRTAKRISEAAAKRAHAATDDDLLNDDVLRTQMVAASVVNASSKAGMDIMTLATKPQPEALKDVTPISRIERVII